MSNHIQQLKSLRFHLLSQLEKLTAEQLNYIPKGFNNNIVWNLGHLIAAQQNLCYVRSGINITVDEKCFTPYLSGTKPESPASEQEITNIKTLFITSMDRLQSDYDQKIFVTYTPSAAIQKIYGIAVNNIDQALEYLIFHEGFHAGYIASMKHLV
jgi:hypothetical protein